MEINNFIQYLQNIKRYSPHTIVAYEGDLKQFLEFCKIEFEINNISTVESKIVRAWVVQLLQSDITSRSVKRKLTSLTSFYKFLIKNEKIKSNPVLKVAKPKSKKSLPSFVGNTEMQQLLNNVNFGDDFEGVRNKLIIELLYDTGIRLSELINLEVRNIDFLASTIKVLGKRNKERIIPITIELITSMKLYMNKAETIAILDKFFFISRKGKKIYEKLVYRVVNHYLGAVSTLTKRSPHVLRHTFATHMLNNGAEINVIKELLGHANLSATQVYTHNSFEKLKSMYHLAHPRA